MHHTTDGSVHVHTSSQSVPATPCWLGEVTLIARYLRTQGMLTAICEHVRFARRRFGRYDVIDFFAVLLGYAISGERTLEDFYQTLSPWASVFMALFDREHLPARSTLSRFFAAFSAEALEALRRVFFSDLLARQVNDEESTAGLWDRAGQHWIVFDIDGTRQAARQRALPQTPELPAPTRRFQAVCAPGYSGRKRGEVMRTRTVVLQAHTHQWLGSVGHPGNGHAQQELRRAVAMIDAYMQAHAEPATKALMRLDGAYGTGAMLGDLQGNPFVGRGKVYQILDQPEVQTRLHLPADQHLRHPESQVVRTLYDCPLVPIGPSGFACRVVVATHPVGKEKPRIGTVRHGLVYELFFTNLPPQAFTAADVVSLYLHRGAFETTLADEDAELDPDRWVSRTACGQECWQILAQWVWNLRLELGHHLCPEPLRTTEFAPTTAPATSGYAPPEVASTWKQGHFSGGDFALQPDGTLRCPAAQRLVVHERRREADGSLRLVYAASILSCRSCRLREQCQWQGHATKKPRQVSLLLHPRVVGSEPILWKDWSRRQQRRACKRLLWHQQLTIQGNPAASPVAPRAKPLPRSRAQRAHWRLSWQERFARNARANTTDRITITLFGLPETFAAFLEQPRR
jgi:hypothetical protein